MQSKTKKNFENLSLGCHGYPSSQDYSEFNVIKFQNLIDKLHSKSDSDIHKYFKELAEFILKESCIQAGDISYRIMECEFYFYSTNHPDPFVHAISKPDNKYAKHKQGKSGEWYFHDSGLGLDITIGNESANIYGGILIRGLRKLDTNENDPFYRGPFNACKELFNNIGGIYDNNLTLKSLGNDITDYQNFRNTKILDFNRIGLIKKNGSIPDEKQLMYSQKKYRFIVDCTKYRNKKLIIIK